MQKAKFIILLVIALFALELTAYQNSFLNLVSPTELGAWESEISIAHRFRGKINEEPLDTFFGMDGGAGVGLFYRQAFIRRIEFKAGYIFDNKEYVADASWSFLPYEYPVQAQADMQFFSFEKYDFDSNDLLRQNNLLLMLSAQNKPLYNRIFFNANLGYDLEDERVVSGLGIGVLALPSLTVLGEYYPVWDRNSAPSSLNLGKHDSYALGLKLDTYGHHFMFSLGNSDAVNLRKLSTGSLDRDLRFGFNIQRHMNFLGR
jgi:hypothetical protein